MCSTSLWYHNEVLNKCDLINFEYLIVGAEVNIVKTSQEGDSKVNIVHFHSKLKVITDPVKIEEWFQTVKEQKVPRVYAMINYYQLTEEDMGDINNMAPPPPVTAPFLLPMRASVFFTIGPIDECFLVPSHVDGHGSGPLVYGPSTTGSYTSFACCTPDYTSRDQPVPLEIQDLFSDRAIDNPARPVHVVNVNSRGGTVNFPAGSWHTVRSYGSSIRAAYFFQQRTIETNSS